MPSADKICAVDPGTSKPGTITREQLGHFLGSAVRSRLVGHCEQSVREAVQQIVTQVGERAELDAVGDIPSLRDDDGVDVLATMAQLVKKQNLVRSRTASTAWLEQHPSRNVADALP